MPDIKTQSADGIIHSFPDGTKPEVIDRVMKAYAISSLPQPAQPIPEGLQGQEPSFLENAIGSSGVGGLGFHGNRPAQEKQDVTSSLIKNAAVTGGAAGAVAALPEMAGGGLIGFLGRTLLRSAASGAGAGAGNITGQALTGDDPLSRENLIETGKIAGFTSALAVPFEAVGGLANTKAGRGAINASIGTTARDLTYANPARGLLREEIADITTGDWESYQNALRAGKTPTEAAQAAGGRFASVSQRINELTPRLGNLLNNSQAAIPVHSVIDQPINNAAMEIFDNPALRDPEKLEAMTKLFELQKSLKDGLGADATPSQLQVIKQAVGNRVNWGGVSAVTDDVKDAYRSVYASIKEAIHRTVPGSGELDNRLTDLLGASSDLVQKAKTEEAGSVPFWMLKAAQKEAGRVLPAAQAIPQVATPAGASIGQQLISKGKIPQAPPNTPGLPFHPNEGQP